MTCRVLRGNQPRGSGVLETSGRDKCWSSNGCERSMSEPMARKRRRALESLDLPHLPPDIVREGHGDLPWAWRLEDMSLNTPHPRKSQSHDLSALSPFVRLDRLDRDLASPSLPSLKSSRNLSTGFAEPAARRPRREPAPTISWEPFFAEKGQPRDLPEILVSEKSATLPWAWRLPFADAEGW